MDENKIKLNNLLIFTNNNFEENNYELYKKFCGTVLDFNCLIKDHNSYDFKRFSFIYFCGDLNKILELNIDSNDKKFYLIKELSFNFYNNLGTNIEMINIGQVPLNYYNVGIFFPKFFEDNYFEKIQNEHIFQQLTESTKPHQALRTGLYITEVNQEKDEYSFNLLRCSTNFSGPTENFCATDKLIINKLNEKQQELFEQHISLNHVLAQIYHINENKKATIKKHSDKTKDMPKNGLIAFCTFYKNDEIFQNSNINIVNTFDYQYKDLSILTRLHFKLKTNTNYKNYEKEFFVTLFPNSVLIIPLSTNRFYTHEIKSSLAPNQYLPLRMGYVVRCSNQKAIYSNEKCFVLDNFEKTPLKKPTDDDLDLIRKLYLEENTTENYPDYSSVKHLSMNDGDFEQPKI